MLAAAKYIGAGVACSGLIGAGAIGKMRFLMRVKQESRGIRNFFISLFSRRPSFLVSSTTGILTATDLSSTLATSTVGAATPSTSLINTGLTIDPVGGGVILGGGLFLVILGCFYNLWLVPRLDRIGVRDVGVETQIERNFEAAMQITTTGSGSIPNSEDIAMTPLNLIASSPIDPYPSLALLILFIFILQLLLATFFSKFSVPIPVKESQFEKLKNKGKRLRNRYLRPVFRGYRR
jgi:hypothetical protein